jgi:hypothetical protein
MKKIFIFLLTTLSVKTIWAQETQALTNNFEQAKNEITAMLEGKQPLSFEKAVFLTENAYNDNHYTYDDFEQAIDEYMHIVLGVSVNTNSDYKPQTVNKAHLSLEQRSKMYEQSANNYRIFKFITDTTYVLSIPDTNDFYALFERHLPFDYPSSDPFGSNDWKNGQVLNLIKNNTGNCFAQSALFKILADRLGSNAHLCIAPGHIYICHANEDGTLFNVETATASFPGSGSLKTLTYSTAEAIKSGLVLRQLDQKQSIALCLVYLAKAYQHRFNTIHDTFMLECAQLALKYDDKNLNAMLLKAEVFEQKILETKKEITTLKANEDFIAYEKLLNNIYKLGYREMPVEMKNMIVSSLNKDSLPMRIQNHTPQAFSGVPDQTRYASLSWGMFEEVHENKAYEQYSRTVFDTKKMHIVKFENSNSLYNNYTFDAVIFALSIDPLTAKYPDTSPYVAFADNPVFYVDKAGNEPTIANAAGLSQFISYLRNQNAKTIEDLVAIFGGMGGNTVVNAVPNKGDPNGMRYLYSKKWGWVDMRHFSAATYTTDYTVISAANVLKKGEEHEAETEKLPNTDPERASSWDYEDLVSNLLGTYFETFLESDKATGKDVVDNLSIYLKDLGFVDNPLSVAPNKNQLAADHGVETNVVNYTYIPKFTTEKRDGILDKKITNFIASYLKVTKVLGYSGNEDRRKDYVKQGAIGDAVKNK